MNEQEMREKVIKGLECCTTQGFSCIENKKCPYGVQRYGSHCVDSMLRDALALLKAQEPVEPVVDVDTWTCGKCGHTLEHQQLLGDNVLFHEQYNYCPECGRKAKWE